MTDVTTQDTTQQENKTTAPRRPIELEVNTLMRLMQEFSEVLEKENELLKAAKFTQIETLQDDKRKYVAEYKSKINELHSRKSEFAAIDHSLAENLIVRRTAFVQLLNSNLRALSSAKSSSRRLVQRIIDTARETVEDKTNYNAVGQMLRSNPQTATSIRFNEEL
jgi:hypothetical protein